MKLTKAQRDVLEKLQSGEYSIVWIRPNPNASCEVPHLTDDLTDGFDAMRLNKHTYDALLSRGLIGEHVITKATITLKGRAVLYE